METLVVLTALVCITIAAPTLPDKTFGEINTTTQSPSLVLSREKKSPQQNSDYNIFSDFGLSSTGGQSSDSTLPMGRSFAFKKPIIVKKKVGYHLYRDSDEEKEFSNPRENCKERVKVKLCDEKLVPNPMSMKSSTIEDINDHTMSEDEIKHSLNMAKEAIANLERDIKKMENKPDMNTAGINNDNISVDELEHKDLDTARQALEHIHQNFGNLESMSFHSTASKNAEELHDIHVTVSKTEEERVAQWKEAMENIQKNIELAKNIEDSFRNPTHGLSSEELEQSQTFENDTPEENNEKNKLINKAELPSPPGNPMDEGIQCSSQIIKIKPIKNIQEIDNLEDDMKTSASTINKSKTESTDSSILIRHDHPENTDSEQKSLSSNTFQPDMTNSKNSELDMMKTNKNDTFLHDQSMTMKSVDSNLGNPLLKDLDTDMDTAASSNNEIESTDSHLLRTSDDLQDLKNNGNLAKSTELEPNTNNGDLEWNNKLENPIIPEHRNTGDEIIPTALTENVPQKQQLREPMSMNSKKLENKDSNTKFMDNMRSNNHFHRKHHRFDDFIVNQDQIFEQNQQSFTDNIDINPQQTNEFINMKSSSPERMSQFDKAAERKEADRFNNNQRDFFTETHFNNPTQMSGMMKTSNNFDSTGPQMHLGHIDKQHHHLTHSNPVFDSASQMNMRDASVIIGSDKNMLHWHPTQETLRSAYGPVLEPAPGSSAGSGTNAVGIFPNANVRGCSIPLLLSCTPSVTSGSLAKAQPTGYASSAYRTDDDFTLFPNKREIKQHNQNLNKTANKILTKKSIETTRSENKH